MPVLCTTCNLTVSRSAPGITCGGSCKKSFHIKCSGLSQDISGEPGVTWTCPSCAANSNENLSQIFEMFKSIKNDITEIKKQQRDLVESVNYCCNKVDDFELKLAETSKQLKDMESLKDEVQYLKAKNSQLEKELNNTQQYNRINNLEISGIPETKNEPILDLLLRVGNALSVKISPDDIDIAHRVGSVSDTASVRNIVVKLKSRLKKNEILGAYRRHRAINAQDLGFAANNRLYISDHLCPSNKLLYKKVRDECKKQNYKYYWVRDCKIFVKKTDNSRPILVESEQDISKLS